MILGVCLRIMSFRCDTKGSGLRVTKRKKEEKNLHEISTGFFPTPRPQVILSPRSIYCARKKPQKAFCGPRRPRIRTPRRKWTTHVKGEVGAWAPNELLGTCRNPEERSRRSTVFRERAADSQYVHLIFELMSKTLPVLTNRRVKPKKTRLTLRLPVSGWRLRGEQLLPLKINSFALFPQRTVYLEEVAVAQLLYSVAFCNVAP